MRFIAPKPSHALRLGSSAVRLALAAALVFLCLQQWPSVMVRDQLDALPDFNYLGAADTLRQQQRYAEALLVTEAGLTNAAPSEQAQLQAEKNQIETERDQLGRRIREVGYGALTGQGDSVEALSGAVAADLLVVGDIRDLAIQGLHAARGEPTDDVIIALSAAGIALTLAPEVDWSVAILKFARRAGALTERFAKSIATLARRAVSTQSSADLVQVGEDFARLSREARPAGAIGILRHVDDPQVLHQAAGFAARPAGAFTLWIGEGASIDWLKGADAAGEDLLLRAGRKGKAGIDLLASRGAVLLRPHPLLGLIKGVYKGNIPELAVRALTAHADAIAGLALGWLAFEFVLLLTLLFAPSRRTPTAAIAR